MEHMRDIAFTKLSGSGNDFICVDARDGAYDDLLGDAGRASTFARVLCPRHVGVGADGLIFALPSEVGDLADLSVRFYEPDGSQAELCGNGTACFTHWAIEQGMVAGAQVRSLTSAGTVIGKRIDDAYVRVCIPLPESLRRGLEVMADDQLFDCDFAVTGVPHLVVYVDDVARVDVERLGRVLRWHEHFQPRGANVNFVQVIRPGEIALRTFEFGVEGETLSCGTGSATAAIFAALRFGWDRALLRGQQPTLVRARSGDVLRVWATIEDDGRVSELCLDTIVRVLFRGTVHPDLAAKALGQAPAPASRAPLNET